jgi:predicted transposase YdaD
MENRRPQEAQKQTILEQQQPYDNVLKLLLENQEAVMLPYFLEDAQFLKVLDLEVLKSPLRVDRVYEILYRGEPHILHLEFEVSGGKKMATRLLVYNSYFLDKYDLPVISIIVYPFETTMAESPLDVKSGNRDLITFHFRTMPLWKLNARDYLDAHAVSMYGLLPTMQGADLISLTEAIEEMRIHYKGDDTRLRRELLCFRTLLNRARTVPVKDKQQIKERLIMFNDLFEDDPFIQEKKAEGRAEGLAEGHAKGLAEGLAEGRTIGLFEGKVEGLAEGKTEGLAEGLQTAIVTVVEARFPSLVPLAEQRVKRVNKPDVLNMLLLQLSRAENETLTRWLLESTAA